MWKLLLLFTVAAAAEVALLLKIGVWLGPTSTFLWLLASGLLGAWLGQREGSSVLRQLRADLANGLSSTDHAVEGALVLLGALLLIIPGVLTDIAGLVLVFPPARRRIAPAARRFVQRRFGFRLDLGGTPGDAATGAQRPSPTANPFASKFD